MQSHLANLGIKRAEPENRVEMLYEPGLDDEKDSIIWREEGGSR
jgi:hypothetical protein